MAKRRVNKNRGQPHVDGSLVVSNTNTSGKGAHRKKISRRDGNPNKISRRGGNPNKISRRGGNPNKISRKDGNPNTNTNTTNTAEASNLNNTTTNTAEAPNLNTTTDAPILNTDTNSVDVFNLNTSTDAPILNTAANSDDVLNLNTTTDGPILNTATNSDDVLNLNTPSLMDELAEWLEFQGEQLSSEIPEEKKGGRLKKVDRKVETCTRCDFIVAVFYNGTHDIQTPVVLPYYMERQSEYLLDCARCKKINRLI